MRAVYIMFTTDRVIVIPSKEFHMIFDESDAILSSGLLAPRPGVTLDVRQYSTMTYAIGFVPLKVLGVYTLSKRLDYKGSKSW